MRHTPSALRITRRLLATAGLITVPLLVAACDTAPKQAAEDAGPSSAHDHTSRSDAAEGMKIRVETRYLLLEDELIQSAFGDQLDDNAVEIKAPANGNAPAEAYLLNDVQVDLLVRAIQASRNSTSLVPSRLTVSSGESGWVRVGDLRPDAGADQTDNDKARPPFDADRPGITFQGGGTVTEDRRHIDLDFRSHIVTKADPEQQAEQVWQTAGRAKVPDQATLLLVGDEIPGTIDLGDNEPEHDNTHPDPEQRPALLIQPSIVIQQARR